MKKLLFSICILVFIGCSQNYQARKLGGTMTFKIPEKSEFINCTWKDESSLWVLYKDSVSNKYYFKENTPTGLMEGKVIFEK